MPLWKPNPPSGYEESKLKPCPCCGGRAKYISGWSMNTQKKFKRVFCASCQLRQLYYGSYIAAFDAWNKRF